MTVQEVLFRECAHERVTVVPEKRGPHHARRTCAVCGKFMGWLPKPETVERRKENERILTALAKRHDLDEWTRNFIRDLVTHKNITPKQQTLLLKMRDTYLNSSA